MPTGKPSVGVHRHRRPGCSAHISSTSTRQRPGRTSQSLSGAVAKPRTSISLFCSTAPIPWPIIAHPRIKQPLICHFPTFPCARSPSRQKSSRTGLTMSPFSCPGPAPADVGQRASMPTVDGVWRVGKHTILAAVGRDGVPTDAQSMFAKAGKHTRTWQTYFR